MMKFKYRIVGIGCDQKRREIRGEHECSSSSACYQHACDIAILDHSIYRIISISVFVPSSEPFPIEVI